MSRMEISTIVLALGLIVAGIARADHNSVWGAGWANMPNDIHNTRIDTMDDDSDAFIDFVRMGSGADSDNRFLVDSTVSGRVTAGRAAGQGGGRR